MSLYTKKDGVSIIQLDDVLHNISEYIRNNLNVTFEEATDITNTLFSDLNKKLEEYQKSQEELDKVALELSNYSSIREFLRKEISKDTFERLKSIDWVKLSKSGGHFEGNHITGRYVWDETCSGRCPSAIKNDLARAAVSGEADSFIKALNELLGNCCITSVNDLDDV